MLHFNTRRVTVAAMIYTVFSSATSCPLNCKENTICNEVDAGCPECKDGWYGRKCEHPLECYTGIGTTYNGTKSISENNITCQHWSSQTPNAHRWDSMESSENYCRNPNIESLEPKPWCYQTEGNRFAMCNIPKCEDQCPPPKLPVFANVINPPPTGFSIGVVLHVTGSCWTGQQINITCQEDKTWSRTLCSVAPWCIRPNVPDPGYISSTQSTFYYNHILSVFCKTGYEIPRGNTGLIRCEENRMWSNIPICESITCTEPVLNENSYISIGKGPQYKYGDTIYVECVERFEAIGESHFECKANREWNGTFPLCRVAPWCARPNVPEPSYISSVQSTFYYNDILSVFCKTGYEIPPGNIGLIRCEENRMWSSIPICERITCTEPVLKENNYISIGKSPQYKYGDTIHVECVEGFEAIGESHFECKANREWNGTFPLCRESDAVETSTVTQVSSVAMVSIGISCVSTIIAVISVTTTVCYVIRLKRNNGSETANTKSKEESHYENLKIDRSSTTSAMYMNTLTL